MAFISLNINNCICVYYNILCQFKYNLIVLTIKSYIDEIWRYFTINEIKFANNTMESIVSTINNRPCPFDYAACKLLTVS